MRLSMPSLTRGGMVNSIHLTRSLAMKYQDELANISSFHAK